VALLYFITVHDSAEFKKKPMCPMGFMVYLQPADNKKRVSNTCTCSIVATLLINTTY
jgi:hypothetical protein